MNQTGGPLLVAEGLTRRYGTRLAVDGIHLHIGRGECLGLLGPNGAGKTSTLAMLAGIARPDAGTVRFADAPTTSVAILKRRIGLVPQDLALHEELTAWANLQLFGGLYGLEDATLAGRAADALALVGLADRRLERVGRFSGGMKRRLNLAAALLHDPDLILLDEPTVGVDPQSRNAIFDNLEELKARGKAMLYTTHYMEEAERLCDRVLIMDHGRALADGPTRSLQSLHGSLEQAFLHLTGRALRDGGEGAAA